MGNFILLVFIGSCLYGVTVAGNFTAGSVKLDNCNDDLIDIRKNENNTLVCRCFSPNATITWSIHRNTTTGSSSMDVAECGPSNCTVGLNQTEHFAVQRLPSQSHTKLFYQQYNTSLDIGAEVTCTSTLGSQTKTQSCKFNVINTVHDTPEVKRLPIGIIVGILAAVAVITIAVVVVLIVCRRQQQQAPQDVTQRSTADGDEYNTLSHTRGAAHKQGQTEVESQYDHI